MGFDEKDKLLGDQEEGDLEGGGEKEKNWEKTDPIKHREHEEQNVIRKFTGILRNFLNKIEADKAFDEEVSSIPNERKKADNQPIEKVTGSAARKEYMAKGAQVQDPELGRLAAVKNVEAMPKDPFSPDFWNDLSIFG